MKERRGPRHEWLRPSSLALVFAGGLVGAAAREALTAVLPAGSGFPVGILVANLLGALLLGFLLEALATPVGDSAGVSAERSRTRNSRAAQERMRLFLGTGFLGGFTTYSSLALAVVALAHEGSPALGVAYGLGTVVLGAAATFLGVALASARRARARVSPETSGDSDA